VTTTLRVLFVEDSEDDAALLVRHLSHGGYEVVHERVENAGDMRRALETGSWDVVISDYVMPRFSGLAALEVLRESGLDTPIIIISGTVGEDVAVEAVKRGAHDYIMKSNLIRLIPSIERELREAEVRRKRQRSEERLAKLSQCLLNLGAEPIHNIDSIVSTGLGILDGDIIKYWRMEGDGYSLQATHSRLGEFETQADKIGRETLETAFMWHSGPITGNDAEMISLREADPDIGRYGLGSLIAHPVMLKGEIVGCLCLFSRPEREFSREETDLAGMLARAISIEEERWADEVGLRDFIEIASHELRHPITIMKGYAITLKEMGDRLGTPESLEILEAIDRGADRLGALLMDLMDTTRIERGEMAILRKEMPFAVLVDAAFLGIKAKYVDRVFNVRIGTDIGVLNADHRRVSQLLGMLLDNAAKFSPPASEIGLTAEFEEGEILVSVLDRGESIPEVEREKIFWRFYQVGDVKYHSIPGIGLGLYIARRIVEAHGGRIWYEPREGGGNTFRFTLPL
jgi:signal transduction histidine kinase